jgi:hypothetical protein
MSSAVLSNRQNVSGNLYSSFGMVELPFQIQIMGLQIHHLPKNEFPHQHHQLSCPFSVHIWNNRSDRDLSLVL